MIGIHTAVILYYLLLRCRTRLFLLEYNTMKYYVVQNVQVVNFTKSRETFRHTQSVFVISQLVLFRETFISNNSAFSQVTTLNPGV